MEPTAKGRLALTIFASGFSSGFTVVVYPALGPLLTDPGRFGLTAFQYGFLFASQIVAAVLAAFLTRRWGSLVGMRRVVLSGTVCSLVAMVALAVAGRPLGTPAVRYAVLLLGTAGVGAGLSATMSALSVVAFRLFVKRPGVGVNAVHLLACCGSMAAPAIVGLFVSVRFWWGAPLTGACLLAAVLLLQLCFLRPAGEPRADRSGPSEHRAVNRLWTWAVLAFLYGACEATLSNWGSVFASGDRGFSPALAALMLTAFWGAIVAGRILFILFSLRFKPAVPYALAPFLTALSFVWLAFAGHPWQVTVGFIAAGLGCSFFFPSSLSFAAQEQPANAAVVSATLMGCSFAGMGLGSNLPGYVRSFVALPRMLGFSSVYALALGGVAIFLVSTYATAARPAAW
jgi:fucose permease